ncbi:hypothetical protein MIR68_012182 [Amoeboaphelidium protococcarum]|nr:hypothetical protein MIR68_012182 [Amoeboaphelidium protococcarum]
MQYLVLKLCSLLTTVVIFTRSIPSEDLPIKCRLRDNTPAGGGPDSCASCTKQVVVSESPSIPCSSNAITLASSSTASSTVQVISSTPSTTTLAVVESITCTSSQLINTSSQDKTSAIPTTQSKFTLYTSSQITSSQSKVVTTEYGSKSTLSTIYTSTTDQIPSLTKTSSSLLSTSAHESIFASTSTTIAVSTTTAVSTPSTKTRRKIRTQRVKSSQYSSAASSSTLSKTKTRPTAPTTVRTTTYQSIPTFKPLESSTKVSKTKTKSTTSKKMSTSVQPPKTTTRQPVITPTSQRPQNPITVPTPPHPAKLPAPFSQKPLVPAPPPPPAPVAEEPPMDNGSSCCASPLVFDVNYDWRVQVKFGTGIWLDPSNVTELHAGADGGDVMLAMPDINGNGQIDIEEVFGNRTLSPFTNVSYKAANGFEALHKLAIEADAQPLCIETSANPKDKSVLVSLPKLKACLQMYGHDLGFISGDNVKVLQPLNQVDTVDVVDYVETPDDCKSGMKHAQKGHYYDKSGHEWRVDDVWFMTGTPYSKGLI